MAALGAAPFATAGSFDQVERWLETVVTYAPPEWGLSADSIHRKCDRDIVCAARSVAGLSKQAYLLKVRHPDTDSIRWVKTRPSVTVSRRLANGNVFIALERFGRTAHREVAAALNNLTASQADGETVLDLRKNNGGSFNNMLRIASLFTGQVDKALFLTGMGKKKPVGIPAPGAAPIARRLVVLVGPETASSGEILAALLRKYAGAELVGERTYGKNYLLRIIPVNNDWRLMLPAERITVPGEIIIGGVRPDRPIPSGTFPALN